MTGKVAPETDGEQSSVSTAEDDSTQSDVATTYAVLATCWREPTERVAETATAGALSSVVGDVGAVDYHDLRAEYTRLFIGPVGPPCPPYESVYRDADAPDEFGPVNGPATMAVRRWYAEFGVAPSSDHTDLPDHIATELEFAAHLAEKGLDERLEQFLDEHLRVWAAEFLTLVENETREAFYASLAATTREVIRQ
ncbi:MULTISPECIES: molecular chaperone [Haloferax]|uniref:Cytoplasmic chaperone TorD family protein n=1 Tax=Haloferax marinum TaxID=2666143 RepID=A0A6A8G7G1_9EURY|nr:MULTISPECIES: molecular chaperone TorD family protein [Haloferax]KAB1197463.1 cytoplasmic chaperone TorD family protein [Haloferax sp. CBA1150]MRW96508.1 cytoplasmic chaperone TorD family protein [Haloferax marinum]